MKLQKMQRLNMIIGLNNPVTKKVNYNTEYVIESALSYLHVDGYTLTTGTGVWKSETENNIILTIVNNFTSSENFHAIIDELYIDIKSILQQEEITVIVDEVLCNL